MAGNKNSGRKKKPAAVKKAEGTYRPDRANEDAPVYDSDSIVMPVELLTEEEQSYWAHYAPKVIGSGVMTEVDVMALVQLCKELWLYFHACEQLEENGYIETSAQGTSMRSPWHIIRKQAYETSHQMMASFGLTPADREKVSAKGLGNTKPVDAGNKFAKLRAVD